MMSAGIANGVRCLACSTTACRTDSTMDGQVHELTPASSSRPGTGSNSSCERSSSSSTRRRSSGENRPVQLPLSPACASRRCPRRSDVAAACGQRRCRAAAVPGRRAAAGDRDRRLELQLLR